MINLTATTVTEEWFSAIPQFDEDYIEDVRAKGAVKDILGSENTIWLGVPIVSNLIDMIPETYKNRLGVQIDHYDFFLMQFSCSFRSHSNCEFTKASVKIEITPENPKSEALAYDMFPEEVYMPISYKKSFSINPEFKIDISKVLQTEVSAFNYANEKDFIIYQPEITAFAKGTSSPGWDFNKSSARSIRGNKDLFLVIRKTKGELVHIGIDILNCYIRTLQLGPIPLANLVVKGTDVPVISKKYKLK